ncbi:hypothetical protein ACHAW6_011053 [Cyclotella cf. meneghiniana]
MAKLKLPKSLLRVLFPKKKKDATQYEELLFPIAEKGEDSKSVNCNVVDDEEAVTPPERVVESTASSSPTVALSFSFNGNNASAENDDSEAENAVLGEDGSAHHDRGELTCRIASRLFSCEEGNDALRVSEREGALTESAHYGERRSSPGLNLNPYSGAIRPDRRELESEEGRPVAMDNSIINESLIDDSIPLINREPSLQQLQQQQQQPPTNMSDRLTSPSAERARLKALARQKRILSKCEERLNALTGTASATLEEATRNSFPLNRKTKEKQLKAEKEKRLNSTDNANKNEEKKKFSTIVFYERPNQSENTPEMNLFTEKIERPLSPITASSEEAPPNDERAVIDQDGFPIGKAIPAPLARGNTPIPFFMLLLDPKSRIFELIEIDDAPLSSSVGDILRLIPAKCTDARLLQMRYVGLCRPSDRVEFIDLRSPAFQKIENFLTDVARQEQQQKCILENDLLVAMLDGSSGFQMCKISKPILKNDKFRDMIRRRRRGNGKETMSVKSVQIVNACQEEGTHPSPLAAAPTTPQEKKEKYNALCKKLEFLSKKLHQVDEEIMAGGVTLVEGTAMATSQSVALDAETAPTPTQEVAYRMSPKMVATELAQHIEDIFADHDVEILAIDADDDDDEESDDGTFVSARSHKSTRSIKSVQSLIATQIEIVASKQRSRGKRRNNTSLFESNEDNALALQIEAMAVQADEAFEQRHGKKLVQRDDSQEEIYEIPDMPEDIEDSYEEGIDVIPEEFESSDILNTMKSLTRGSTTVDVSNCTPCQKEAFSRNFLNTSTSMVSTMVAATHGRVNEVHVLQYLGCTIVCIAANFAQQRQEKQSAQSPTTPGFGARQIFQSAMFLAFMVNGQRYLAKVAKK